KRGIAAQGATRNYHARGGGAGGTKTGDPAAKPCDVPTEGAVGDEQRGACQVAAVKDSAALVCPVSADGAVTDCDRRLVVVNPAAAPGNIVAVGDGQARNADGLARRDIEHAADGVAVNGQIVGTRAEDLHALINDQLAGG